MVITLLSIFGFFALAMIVCFYCPRICVAACSTYLFVMTGIKTTDNIIFASVLILFMILGGIAIYFDFKNLQLNPFKKQK